MAKDKNQRDLRDHAGMGPDPRQITHLTPLRELKKFKVGDGEPDIRGWPVFSSSGQRLGEISELLVDTRLNQVAMIHLRLADTNRHTVAPIRAAWIDRDTKRVVLNEADFRVDEDLPVAHAAAPGTGHSAVAAHATEPAATSDDERPWQHVRYADDQDEVVVERRPVVMEEVVVRRREVDPSELSAAEREQLERERLERERLEGDRHRGGLEPPPGA